MREPLQRSQHDRAECWRGDRAREGRGLQGLLGLAGAFSRLRWEPSRGLEQKSKVMWFGFYPSGCCVENMLNEGKRRKRMS